ncbi:MAG TPA: formyltransferase family protein, partial [Clostridia bacterium]|nr:formyltransferase family protein [Clostridia bacterium]
MSPIKIGVLISGNGSNLQAIIDQVESGHINGRIELVISNKESAYGLIRSKNAGIE